MKAWLSSVYHSNPFYHVHVLHFKKVRKQNSVTPQSLLAKWSKCLVCEQKYFKGLQSIFTEQREGVKDRHEPHEMTSGASWYAECPQSPAKPSPRHSLLFKPPPSLSPCLPFCPQIKYIWLLYPQKTFFSYILTRLRRSFRGGHGGPAPPPSWTLFSVFSMVAANIQILCIFYSVIDHSALCLMFWMFKSVFNTSPSDWSVIWTKSLGIKGSDLSFSVTFFKGTYSPFRRIRTFLSSLWYLQGL